MGERDKPTLKAEVAKAEKSCDLIFSVTYVCCSWQNSSKSIRCWCETLGNSTLLCQCSEAERAALWTMEAMSSKLPVIFGYEPSLYQLSQLNSPHETNLGPVHMSDSCKACSRCGTSSSGDQGLALWL